MWIQQILWTAITHIGRSTFDTYYDSTGTTYECAYLCGMTRQHFREYEQPQTMVRRFTPAAVGVSVILCTICNALVDRRAAYDVGQENSCGLRLAMAIYKNKIYADVHFDSLPAALGLGPGKENHAPRLTTAPGASTMSPSFKH